MRRTIAALAITAMATTMTAVAPAAAHDRGTCGANNTLNPLDGTGVRNPEYRGRKTTKIDLREHDKGMYYVDDRDFVGWGSLTSLPNRAVESAKASEVGWTAYNHDHSGGLWVFEETGRKRGLQRGSNKAAKLGPVPKDVRDAFFDVLGAAGSFADPCKQSKYRFRDRVVV